MAKRRKADDEVQRAIRDSLEENARLRNRPPPSKEPLPKAANELGPPGSSSGLHGSAGEGGYDLAKAKQKRRAKVARIRAGGAVA
jgi:hypothetical protein